MKIDLHNHLGVNGKNPGFDETIDLVYNKRGPNFMFGICNSTPVDYRFENFANQKGGKYEREWLDDKKIILAVPEKQIYIIGAEEVITRQGHLVVAGMPSNKKIQKNEKILSLEDALKSATDFNGIKIAAHPFGKDGLGRYLSRNFYNNWQILDRKDKSIILCNSIKATKNSLLNNFDGWEVYNATAELAIPPILPFKANEKSRENYYNWIISNFYIGVCAFTDGHSVEVIGKSYTNLDLKDISVNSLRNLIRANRDPNSLHMEPAKWDAFKHAVNMVKHKLFNVGA